MSSCSVAAGSGWAASAAFSAVRRARVASPNHTVRDLTTPVTPETVTSWPSLCSSFHVIVLVLGAKDRRLPVRAKEFASVLGLGTDDVRAERRDEGDVQEEEDDRDRPGLGVAKTREDEASSGAEGHGGCGAARWEVRRVEGVALFRLFPCSHSEITRAVSTFSTHPPLRRVLRHTHANAGPPPSPVSPFSTASHLSSRIPIAFSSSRHSIDPPHSHAKLPIRVSISGTKPLLIT